MVGLSIVLETATTLRDGVISPKPHQVVNKATGMISATRDAGGLRRGSFCPDSGFLEHCFLCKKKLLPAMDIYMYKGDRAFCSMECRSRQMIMDEEQSLSGENCSSMAPAPSRHRRDPRNRAGGFAY